MRALGDDLAAVVDELVPADSPLHLGGHSMGGMTVMAYAGSHPDEFTRRLRRVLLASTAISGVRRKGLPLERRVGALANRVPGRMRLIPATAAARQFGSASAPADVAALLAMLRTSRVAAYSSYFSALLDHDESRAAQTLSLVPVTVVTGTSDTILPHRVSERAAAAIPGAELHVLDSVGHMTPYEVPDLLVRALVP
ncbi:hypothetical protein VV01_16385 [Luteipulveratus halotolerans]|uniref:AB hydrolase-1 domain-containing protein n=1 Tax=Luteipulveratus halotolerans TaxID=1631356 RepID=A0A0L6CLG2_9MICO|nr:hypothetical protein VV01_16385 [Luteipulveratus halotolerans]